MQARFRSAVMACAILTAASGLAGAVHAELEVQGRVVDEAGKPIARAVVELSSYPRRSERARVLLSGRRFPEPIATVETSAEGRYLIRVPEPGMWKVLVRSPGRIPMGQYLLPLTGDRDLPDAELRTDAGVVIRVVDAEGKAVSKAQVRLAPLEGYPRTSSVSRWWEEGRLLPANEEGRVEAARPSGATLQVTAWAPGFVPSEKVTVSGASGVVRLERGKSVPVRFVQAEAPVAEALVGIGRWSWIGGFTAEDGGFEVWVRPDDPLELALQLADGATYSASVTRDALALERPGSEEPAVEIVRLPAPEELVGTVFDAESGEPVPEAFVWSGRDSGHFVRTGADGGYRLREFSQADLRIAGAASGYKTTWSSLAGESDKPEATTISLSPSIVLTGRVVDSEGLGVPAAEVQAVLPNHWRHPTTGTREDGSFRFEDLDRGETYEIVARAPGYAPGREAVSVGPRTTVEIELGRGRALVGTVVDRSRAPVAGAEVRLGAVATEVRSRVRDRGKSGPDPVRTDAQGAFVIAGLGEEPMALLARAAGFADRLITAVPTGDGEPVVDAGEIVLEPETVLRGVVRNRAGSAVESARVQAYVDSYMRFLISGSFEDSLQRTAVSDADGRFSLEGLGRGEHLTLDVRHDQYVSETVERVLPDGDEPLEIVLERAARLSGRVENQEGQPVPGARVSVEALAGDLKLSSPWGETGRAPAWGRSAQDGSFSISGVAPGEVDVSAEGPGYLRAKPLRLTLAGGEERSGAVVVLERGATIEGRVIDSAGKPVLGAELWLMLETQSSFAMSSRSVTRATTDGNGRFRLDGVDPKAREVVLRASHRDYVDAEERFVLEPGLERVIVLETGSTVAGFVLTGAGSPVDGARVTLARSSDSYSTNEPVSTSLEDGSFEIAGVALGTYLLTASKEGFARSSADKPIDVGATPVRGVTVHLEPGGKIFGAITGLEPSELNQVQIIVRGDSGSLPILGLVDAEGNYRVEHVPFERGSIVAGSRATGQHVAESFELDPEGGETRVDLDFPEGATLSGTVTLDGELWVGAYVSVEGGALGAGGAQTNQTGRFEIRGLADGRYRVVVAERGGTAHLETVDVAGATEVAIEVRSVEISGRVTAADSSEPIEEATVLVAAERVGQWTHRGAQAVTSGRGEYRLRLPAGGSATIQARASGYSEAQTTVNTSEGNLSGVDFELEPGAGLDLGVELWTGLEPTGVSLALVDENGRRILAQYLRSVGGRYRVNSAPPGRWRLLLQAHDSAVVSVPVEIPGPPLNLVLPEGARIEVDLGAVAEAAGLGKVRVVSPDGSPLRVPGFDSIVSEWPVTGMRTMIGAVPPGDWLVDLVSDSGTVWRQEVSCRAGETAKVEFE